MTMIIDGTNGLTFPDTSKQYNSYYSFKNRIINGAMVIDQRNAGASVTFTNQYLVDRWVAVEDTDGAMTAQQVADAPAGFVNSLKFTTTTADASLAATQYVSVAQSIEGNNTSDLAWGTASAQTITLSFWVKSSLTGTFGGSLRNDGYNRSYPFTFTISAANTWEQKTITIPGDTSGTWATSTAAGIRLSFGLGVGSTYSGTAGSWSSSNFITSTGATSVVGTNGATFYITGVQLEKGTQATSFDYRPYGTELALCQRYYAEVGKQLVGRSESATIASMACSTPVKMRVAPTPLVITSSNGLVIPGIAFYTISSISSSATTDNAVYLAFTSSGMTSGTVVVGGQDRVLSLSSEL